MQLSDMMSRPGDTQSPNLDFLFSQLDPESKKKIIGETAKKGLEQVQPQDLGGVISQLSQQQQPSQDLQGISNAYLDNAMKVVNQKTPSAVPTNGLAQFAQSFGRGMTGMPIDMGQEGAGWQNKLGATIGNEFGQSALRSLLYGPKAVQDRKPFSDSPTFINTPEEAAKSASAIKQSVALEQAKLPYDLKKAEEMSKIKIQYKYEPEMVQGIGDAIISGQQPPDFKGNYGMTPYVKKYLADKGFDLTKAIQNWQGMQNLTKTMTNQQHARLYETFNSVEKQIPELSKLSNEFDRYNWRPANKVELMAAVNGFDKNKAQLAVKYIGQINVMRDELAQAFSGGYAPTESSFKLADSVLDPLYNAKQMDASLEQLQFNLNTRRSAITDTAVGTLGNVNQIYMGNQQQQQGASSGISPEIANRAAEILKKRQQSPQG